MREEEIINLWVCGMTTWQIAQKLQKNMKSKMTTWEALAVVEPIIYRYETQNWNKKDRC